MGGTREMRSRPVPIRVGVLRQGGWLPIRVGVLRTGRVAAHLRGCSEDREAGWKWSLGASRQPEVLDVAVVWVWPRD